MKLLADAEADVIALQEVTPWLLHELRGQAWAKAYHMPMKDGQPWPPGGLLIMSRNPIRNPRAGPLPGRQGRAWLVVETQVGGVQVAVATCHLESPLAAGHTRAKQLDVFFDRLHGHGDALFLGDFNFGDGEQPETARLREAYVDAWRATQGDSRGFTWDMHRSAMARRGAFQGEVSRRLDRILVKSNALRPAKAIIIGDEPVDTEGHVFPSDHFGLLVELTVATGRTAE